MPNLQALPTDVLVDIIDCLDLGTKGLLAFCNKALLDQIGTDVFRKLSQTRDARYNFLSQLEKDFPTSEIFCPGCLKFHSAAQVQKGTVGYRGEYTDNLPCVKQDLRSETPEFYGENFYFIQARLAMSLYRRQDPRASQCLRDLEGVHEVWFVQAPIYQFYQRNLKITRAFPDYPSQLVMRFQQWCVIPDRSIEKGMIADDTRFRLYLCFHNKELILGPDPLQKPFSLGFSLIKKARAQLTSSKDQHLHTSLKHCSLCDTDYRMDVVYLPDARLLGPRFIHHRSPHWAIVITKWMNLGTLNAQDSEWQAHAWKETGQKLNLTTPTLGFGRAAQLYELGGLTGSDSYNLEYRPQWSKELEVVIKDVWRES